MKFSKEFEYSGVQSHGSSWVPSFATDGDIYWTSKSKKKSSKKTLAFMKKKTSFTIGVDSFPSKEMSSHSNW